MENIHSKPALLSSLNIIFRAFVSLTLSAVYVNNLHAQGKTASSEATEQPLTEVANTAPPRPAASDGASLQLVQNYLTVTGGKEAHDRLLNVVATGTSKISTLQKRFQLVETQDGKRHLRYTWTLLGRQYEEVYVFDGLMGWKQKIKPELEDAVPYADTSAEGMHFIHQRWLLQPFVLPSSADYVFKYQGGARVRGRPTHIVVGYGKKDERSWFYFDKEKFLLLRWGGIGSMAEVRVPIDYKAYRFKRVGGVLLPREIEMIAGGDVFGKIVFESFEVNQSIGDINFTMPPPTVPVLRQRTSQPR
ncbi:MAG: hypothetical protein ACPGSB_07340 [Opitutales bacterium]